MRIWEIDFTKVGCTFQDSNDNEWVIGENMNLYCEHLSGAKFEIKNWYSLHELLIVEFTEVINWSKVAVDTPVWVRTREYDKWSHRHFSGYDNTNVFCFIEGKTSHTETIASKWNYCSLTDPNKGE